MLSVSFSFIFVYNYAFVTRLYSLAHQIFHLPFVISTRILYAAICFEIQVTYIFLSVK